jgi:hypothetical protein
MAKQATWVGGFIAIATLGIAAAVIGYQEYRGCGVKSLGEIIRAEFYDCPASPPVLAKDEKAVASGDFYADYDKYLIGCNIPIVRPLEVNSTLGAVELTVQKMADSIVPYGGIERTYECHVSPKEGKALSDPNPVFWAKQKVHFVIHERFDDQGRVCGRVSFTVDWTANGKENLGRLNNGKFCMSNGSAMPIVE